MVYRAHDEQVQRGVAVKVLPAGMLVEEEAKKAFELSESLPRADRPSIKGRYRGATNDWEKATEIYKLLFGFFPDNFESGLQLVSVQSTGRKTQEALETIGKLRSFPAPSKGAPRIDLAEGQGDSGWREG